MVTSAPRSDLNQLAQHLEQTFQPEPPVGAVVGRTRIRDAVALERGCSQMEAEELVDTMVEQNLLRFESDAAEPGVWRFAPWAGPD